MSSTNRESNVISDDQIEEAADAMWDAIDDKGIHGRLHREDCQYLARSLADNGLLAGPAGHFHEEWAAVVGWRNEHGQTEQNRGYGDTREAALADARSQPRMMLAADEDEVAHKTVRRYVSSWEEA